MYTWLHARNELANLHSFPKHQPDDDAEANASIRGIAARTSSKARTYGHGYVHVHVHVHVWPRRLFLEFRIEILYICVLNYSKKFRRFESKYFTFVC